MYQSTTGTVCIFYCDCVCSQSSVRGVFIDNHGTIWTVQDNVLYVIFLIISGDELSQRRISCRGVCTGSHSKTHELHQRL